MPWLTHLRLTDYQQLTRQMVVDKFKEEEADNKNALTPVSSRASATAGGAGHIRGPQEDETGTGAASGIGSPSVSVSVSA